MDGRIEPGDTAFPHDDMDVLECITDPAFVHDHAFRIVRANAAYLRAAGVTADEVMGRHYWEVFPPADGPSEACQRARADGTAHEGDVTLPDGSTLRERAYPRRRNDGTTFALHIIELQNRGRHDDVDREAREHLSAIVNASADGILSLDPEGRVQYANPAAGRVLGRDPERIIGSSFGFPILESETTQVSLLHPDGERRFADLRSLPIPDHGEGGHVVTLHDVTERVLLERERLAHARDLKNALVETVQAMGLALEVRDPYTAGHQKRVADLAAAIARALGLPDERVEGVHLGGVIHDIGKLYVPSEILSRPGRLSRQEFELIKTHSEKGHEIVKGIRFAWPVDRMIRHHHERWDGSGYPDGLSGTEILLEARIMAVADVIEAIASHRPYRPALGLEVALSEIREGRGIRYDPDVADAALDLFAQGLYSLGS